MCGRATLTAPREQIEEIAELLGVSPVELGPPKYNVAPTQPMLVVRERRDHRREMAFVRWGLIPHWAKAEDAKRLSSRQFQARLETAPRAPAFRDAFRAHRCLVIVDGFYEWQTVGGGERVPHHVRRPDGAPFAIGGLWASWKSPDGEWLDSCAVLTTKAITPVAELHDRMPLVLPRSAYEAWLTGSPASAADVATPSAELVAIPVSKWVNDVKHDDPRCIEPVGPVRPPDAIARTAPNR
jgi:putative SOS response-associated peptidase YedK